MKEFDLEAAKKGARVCTRDGRKARILCFDSGGVGYRETPLPIMADVKCGDTIFVFGYQENGLTDENSNRINDLMMDDDDYIEKLERGEYGFTGTVYDLDQSSYTDPDPSTDPWPEFKRQAALELLRAYGPSVGIMDINGIISRVNRLVEGLKGE